MLKVGDRVFLEEVPVHHTEINTPEVRNGTRIEVYLENLHTTGTIIDIWEDNLAEIDSDKFPEQDWLILWPLENLRWKCNS